MHEQTSPFSVWCFFSLRFHCDSTCHCLFCYFLAVSLLRNKQRVITKSPPYFFSDFPWRILVSATSVVFILGFVDLFSRITLCQHCDVNFSSSEVWHRNPIFNILLSTSYIHSNTLTNIHHQLIKQRARLIIWCLYSWLLSSFLIEFYNLAYCIQSFWFVIDCHSYTERTQTQGTQAGTSWCPEYEIQSPMSKIPPPPKNNKRQTKENPGGKKQSRNTNLRNN